MWKLFAAFVLKPCSYNALPIALYVIKHLSAVHRQELSQALAVLKEVETIGDTLAVATHNLDNAQSVGVAKDGTKS
ncbi:MAG: hypothetical protein WCH39_20995 [Schlesneria sp.]